MSFHHITAGASGQVTEGRRKGESIRASSELVLPRSRRWLFLIVNGLAVLVLIALSQPAQATPSLQATASATAESFNKHIDVGGYKLYISCVGQGQPTVVLDSGAENWSIHWEKVMPALAKFTRVCAYDRAGLGSSDPRSQKGQVTVAETVKELHSLLANAQLEPPYVLVGHSFGGMNVLYYATQYPAQTAGLVLVDAVPPKFIDRFPNHYLRPMDDQVETINTASKLFAEAGPLPNVPLIVLAHTPDKLFALSKVEESAWQALQAEQAQLSPQGILIVADSSGHRIQYDQPDLVINAVRRVVETVRKGTNEPTFTPFWTPMPVATSTPNPT